MDMNEIRQANDGKLPEYAWPGGYPMYYLAKDDGVLCPACANQYTVGRDNDRQLEPVVYGINYEDTELYCENCDRRIESAYAEEAVEAQE